MIIKTLVDQLLTFWLLNLTDHLVDLHLLIFIVHSEIRFNVDQVIADGFCHMLLFGDVFWVDLVSGYKLAVLLKHGSSS